MTVAGNGRALRWNCLACLFGWIVPPSGLAGTPERDKAWDALVAQAVAHGGVETRLDQSASYVFKRPDGSFVTFTHILKGQKRAVCLITETQSATACLDWDNGKLTLGDRKDAASPWRFRAKQSLDAFEAEQPGFFQQLLSTIERLALSGGKSRKSGAGGYWRYSNSGNMYWVSRN